MEKQEEEEESLLVMPARVRFKTQTKYVANPELTEAKVNVNYTPSGK